MSEKLLKKFDVTIHSIADNIIIEPITRNTVYLGQKSAIKGLSFQLNKKCSLVYYLWPSCIPKPIFDAGAEYQEVNVHGLKKQPRETLNYGVAYKYSRVKHTLEKHTPTDIAAAMEYTECMYEDVLDKETTDTMCLANRYTTGYHCISRHSDEEGQSSSSCKDVICWVVGAARRLIFRNSNKRDTDIVLSVSLPEGIYIMRGKRFQRSFTHEIPREKVATFNKLCIRYNKAMVQHFSSCIEDSTTATQRAEWLSDNGKIVKGRCKDDMYCQYKAWSKKYRETGKLRSGDQVLLKTLAKRCSVDILESYPTDKLCKADWLSENRKIIKLDLSSQKDSKLYDEYKEWNLERCSYTIRFFSGTKPYTPSR